MIMKHIAVSIPDNKEMIFRKILQSLSFVKNIQTIEQTDIPEWHKSILDERINNYTNNPDSFKSWEDVQKEISQKYGL